MYIYTHIHTHTDIYTSIYICIYTYRNTYMHLSAPSPQIQIRTTNASDGLLMFAQRKGAYYIHRIFAHFMHIFDQNMHATELYCLAFSAEPISGLGQSSTADQPWMAHGANTMGPFKWSHIYIRWDVLSRELQNGSFRKTFELEYLEIFNKLWFYFSNNRGSPATILTQNYWVNSLEWTKSSLSFSLSPVIGLGLRLPRKKNRSHIQQHHKRVL